MHRLYHDFNKTDVSPVAGLVAAPLVCRGTHEDLKKMGLALSDGMKVLLYQEDIGPEETPDFLEVEATIRRVIEQALGAVRRPAGTVRRILDLPCGHGRVLRFLRAAFPHAELAACDLNRDGVDFCAQTFGAKPIYSDPDPTRVPLPSDFDLIWCGSLLTHLSAAQGEAFMALFHRALAPGGLAVVTLHGRPFAEELASGRRSGDLPATALAELLRQYRTAGFGYVDYPSSPGYGFSLMHPSHTFGRLVAAFPWRVVCYSERGWDRRQDVLVLQKPH